MTSLRSNSIISTVYQIAVKYPTPASLSYLWNFGIFALVALISQLITGIFLAMHYTPHVNYAFESCDHIMRDVNFGWLLRYLHANGASLFFIVVYSHILRGLIYGSYLFARELLWTSGVLIFLIMIITAFLGYILPWGQMSLWGATVITNLASTIPSVGEYIVIWLWGGYSVANPTLNKFFSLHFVFPFIIIAGVALHVALLHHYGSSNPLGIDYAVDKTNFTPYYTLKDLFSVLIFFMFATILVFFVPNLLGHPDNYVPANPDITPAHIVPEWYFLPFYAILRAIPDKALGVLALLLSILILMVLPYLHSTFVRSALFKPLYKYISFMFIGVVILLGYLGAKPIEEPYLTIAIYATLAYFFYFVLAIIGEIYDFLFINFFYINTITKTQKALLILFIGLIILLTFCVVYSIIGEPREILCDIPKSLTPNMHPTDAEKAEISWKKHQDRLEKEGFQYLQEVRDGKREIVDLNVVSEKTKKYLAVLIIIGGVGYAIYRFTR